MKKKQPSHHKKGTRKEKPLPEAVLQRLEKKKARLAKKLAEPHEEIKKPKKFKKRQKSYQYGMESLESQISDTKEELTKSLKKRPLPPDLHKIMEEEATAVKKLELARKLREKVLQLAMERAEKVKED